MTYFQKVYEQSMSQSQAARQRSSEWICMKFYLPRQGPSLHLSIGWHGSPTILVDVLAYQQYKEPILRFSGLEMLIKISWLTTLTDDKIANQKGLGSSKEPQELELRKGVILNTDCRPSVHLQG